LKVGDLVQLRESMHKMYTEQTKQQRHSISTNK